MQRMICLMTILAAVSLMSASCEPGAGNTGNKPANAVNNAANNAAPAANTAAIEGEIKKLVNDTAAALAKNDVAALEKMYNDNYMLVNLDGSVQNRADRLASFRSGETKFDSFAYDEVNVRVNPEGTGAIVISRATATGMNKGRKIEGSIRVTQVWRKTNDGWRQVTGHATPITAAAGDDKKAANSNTAANGAKPPPPPPANE